MPFNVGFLLASSQSWSDNVLSSWLLIENLLFRQIASASYEKWYHCFCPETKACFVSPFCKQLRIISKNISFRGRPIIEKSLFLTAPVRQCFKKKMKARVHEGGLSTDLGLCASKRVI